MCQVFLLKNLTSPVLGTNCPETELTPGHSKAVLATYVAGSDAKVSRGLLVSMTLSFTHVTIAVLIAVVSLPLVSIALGSVGRAPLLEDVSRGLLGLIGLWMLWRALSHGRHHKHEGEAVGVMAGLMWCWQISGARWGSSAKGSQP